MKLIVLSRDDVEGGATRGMVPHVLVSISCENDGAVAAALTKIDGGRDDTYFKRYIPNRRVYSLILAEYYNEPR